MAGEAALEVRSIFSWRDSKFFSKTQGSGGLGWKLAGRHRSARPNDNQRRAGKLLSLGAKLTKKASVIGFDPLLYEPTLIVKPEDVRQVPDYALAVGR